MKIQKISSRTILVMSKTKKNAGCPRLVVNRENASFRDDYKGNIILAKKLLRKISLL